MCGIVGYTGKREAVGLLMDGLRCLEYRGYDSAGVSFFEEGRLETVKAKGRISNLEARLSGQEHCSHCGIAHTRWATHGAPSDTNSHPHTAKHLSLVHNGIIENFAQLRRELEEQGAVFVSETDTEVAARLIDSLYEGDPMEAIIRALKRLRGAFAFGIVFRDYPDRVYAVRNASPLIAARGEGESFIASDIPAILPYTKQYYILESGEMAVLTPDAIQFFDWEGHPVQKELLTSTLTVQQAEKGGYDHFMLKEIHEQPQALRDTLSPRLADGLPDFSSDGLAPDFFRGVSHIHIAACGSASYAGQVGRWAIERLARIPVTVEIASEFRYQDPILAPGDLVIVISQSGETADSLAALRLAKERGVPTLAIVNVAGSSIAREADFVLYTHAGPEIAVATTKGYSVQVGILYLIALRAALEREILPREACAGLVSRLQEALSLLPQALELEKDCSRAAQSLRDVSSMFYIGRGQDHSLSLEGALKLKEISYIQCEAYAAGELKHGTISLITQGTPVVALLTESELAAKTVSNIQEVKARGAMVIAVCLPGISLPEGLCDILITLPPLPELFAPLGAIIPLQFLAYHTACLKGCDVDKPRNLAKSVTVE